MPCAGRLPSAVAEVVPAANEIRSAAASGGFVGSGVGEGAGGLVVLGSGASVALGLGLVAAGVSVAASVGVSVATASTVGAAGGAAVGAAVLLQAESTRPATNSAPTIMG